MSYFLDFSFTQFQIISKSKGKGKTLRFLISSVCLKEGVAVKVRVIQWRANDTEWRQC